MRNGNYKERVLDSFYANLGILLLFIFITIVFNAVAVGAGTIVGWILIVSSWGLGVAFGKRRVSQR